MRSAIAVAGRDAGKLGAKAGKAIYFLVILAGALFILDFLARLVVGLYVKLPPVPSRPTDLTLVNYASTVALSLSFLISSALYLRYVDRSKRSVPERLGLGRKMLTAQNLLIGVYLFILIFALEVLVDIISSVTNIQISTNVNLFFAGAPLWFYAFSAVLAPIDEEIMFRGLLVPRIGIVAAAIIFALPHVTYGSTFYIEVIAAFVFGVLSGYAYKKTGSLYPSIVAHIMVNTLSLASVLSLVVRLLARA